MVKDVFKKLTLLGFLLAESCFAEKIFVEKGQQQQIQINQTHGDLAVHLVSPLESFRIDHPLGQSGIELLFVGPYSESTSFHMDLEFKSRIQRVDYELKVVADNDMDTKYAALINQAGILYAQTKDASAVIDIYSDAASLGETTSWLRDYALYLAINSALLARQPFKAKEIISSKNFSGQCDIHCYKQSMIRGYVEFETDNYAKAVEYFEKAIDQLRGESLSSGAQMEKAELLATYGFSLTLIGNPKEGLVFISEARELAYHLGDQGVKGKVLSMEAGYQAVTGDLHGAAESLLDAANFLEEAGDNLSKAEALINLSMANKLLGDYQDGISSAQQALSLIRQFNNPVSLIGPTYDRLANLYEIVGDNERAVQFFELSYEHETKQGRMARAMRAQGQIASNLRGLGKLSEAENLHRKSLEFFVDSGDIGELIIQRQELALDLVELRRLDEAMSEIELALSFREQAPGFTRIDELNLVRAQILQEQLKFEEAKALLTSSLAEFEAADAPLGTQIRYGVGLMRVNKEMGDIDEAVEAGHRVLAQIRDVRTDLEIRRLGPAWSRQTHGAVSELADIYLQRYSKSGDTEDAISAFEILESGQANALRNQITSTGGRTFELFDSTEETKLKQRLTVIANNRASALVGSSELVALTTEYYKVLELLEASRIKSFSKDVNTNSKLRELQHSIPAGSLALRYYCPEPSRCWLFNFDRSHFDVNLVAGADLEKLVHVINDKLKKSDSAEQELQRLSSILNIDRFKSDATGYDRLLISADYPFNLLPFAALPLSGDERLAGQFAIVSSPSLTGMITAKDPPGVNYSLDLAVLADPAFDGFLSAENALVQTDQDVLRSWSEGRQRLPWSAEEANALEELYGDSSLAVYTGEQANRTNLLDQRTRNARILHIASHAYFNEATPDLVGIAISPDKGREGTGFITLDELLSYPMNNELVVISGCETGAGEYYPGEGDMSLARGFHAKGARQVLSTRWPVSDRASALFMRYFHEALREEGLSAEFALASAQKRMKQNPRYRAPVYWAGYVLSSTSL